MTSDETEKPDGSLPSKNVVETTTPPASDSNSTSDDEKNKPTDGEQARRPSSTPSTRPQAILHEIKEQTAAGEGEDLTEYPGGFKLTMIVLALCFAIFCMALDNTIIATAIPRITDHFHALNDVGWYGSAYLLTICSFQLFFGKLYTFFSIKWVFLAGLSIFEIGSAVCGAAPSSVAFIIGRAVAGVGAAGIFSGAILIVAHTVPLVKRPMYTGLIASMYGLASVAGPLLGGVFTDKVSWRWCFYINLPLGAATVLFIVVFFKSPVKPDADANLTRTVSGNHMQQMTFFQSARRFDIEGTAVFVPSVVCLLLALQWGGSQYTWGSWRIIMLLVFFAVLMLAFIGIQIWKQENATVPPRVLKQRTVASGAWFATCLGASFFIMVYYIPIWFQAVKGVSAVKSGIQSLPMILGLVIISLVAGGAITAVGYYTPFTIASSVFMSIGAGLLSTFTVTTNHPLWIGYQFIFGMGVGFGMQQPLIAVQTVLPLNDVPIGTAIIMFSQTLGGALFISVGQNVFTNSLQQNLKAIVPHVNPKLILRTGATTLRDAVPQADLPGVLIAYNHTLDQTFYVSLAMAVASVVGSALMEWKSVKGQKLSPAAA